MSFKSIRSNGDRYLKSIPGQVLFGSAKLPDVVSSPVSSVQRGVSTGPSIITITPVNFSKSVISSISKGSKGTVMTNSNLSGFVYSSTATAGSTITGTPSAPIPLYGVMTGGTTDLTTKQYSAVLTNNTTVTCDGPCEWQVVEYV